MDALVASFVAAFLCGWGDRTQLLAAALTARTERPVILALGLLAALLAGNLFAAFAGAALVGVIPIRAAGLLLGLALLLAGFGGLLRRRAPNTGSLSLPLILAATIMLLAAQIADRAPFITFALAARFDAPLLAAAGGAAGALAACLPALALGDEFATKVPLRVLRLTIAALLLVAGVAVSVNALRLV